MFAAQVLDKAEHKARRAGASFVRVAAACIMAILACGFLTAAAWIYLDAKLGPVAASTLLGIFFALVAVGLLVLKPRRKEPEPKPKVGLDDLVQAFVAAAALGRSTRR